MNIEICINTNNYSGKDVQIDLKDIMDFTRNMYVEGNCEAVVKFECMPAAVYPDLIQVVLKNMDQGLQIIGDILTLKELLKIILEFLKKCIGYEKEVVLDDNNGDIIEITDETTDEELQGKILKSNTNNWLSAIRKATKKLSTAVAKIKVITIQ